MRGAVVHVVRGGVRGWMWWWWSMCGSVLYVMVREVVLVWCGGRCGGCVLEEVSGKGRSGGCSF